MRPLRIYIAGPYTGNEVVGTANMMQVAQRIALAGHFPYAPLWMHYADHADTSLPNMDYEFCIDHCLSFLSVCDMLVRLPGTSKGADKEWEEACKAGKPVITLDSLEAYLQLPRVAERAWKKVEN